MTYGLYLMAILTGVGLARLAYLAIVVAFDAVMA